jgi:hypothetical protein
METMNGVVNISTGLLLRAGYCDFTLDPNFYPSIEAQYGDTPNPCYIFNDFASQNPSDFITHWNGNGWDEVPRIGIKI